MNRRISILILEDEKSAANQLRVELDRIKNTQFLILGVIETVREAIKWLRENQAPDLIFMDIQLADGLSLELFDRDPLPCPVIFCTAYDQYAVETFHLNAVDYLLKPIVSGKLQRAIDNFIAKSETFSQEAQFGQIKSILARLDKSRYRSSFLIHSQQKMLIIQTSEISYFSLSGRKVYITTKTGEEYPIDLSLEQVYGQMDPAEFVRANRQMIISKSAIQNIEKYGLGKLVIKLNPPSRDKVIISKEKAPAFREWANS